MLVLISNTICPASSSFSLSFFLFFPSFFLLFPSFLSFFLLFLFLSSVSASWQALLAFSLIALLLLSLLSLLQAVMTQHEHNPSGAPDQPSGKKKRNSLRRQVYKQKQRARTNPLSSQAVHQSEMTDPKQPAALPTSGTPDQQVPGCQADVSMLLRPAAASAAAVMTDPGLSAAAPAAHVTDAERPSGKLSRRQKMRLSFQRQLAAAQTAAVMQQQQQQLAQNKVDEPAFVTIQGPSKVYCMFTATIGFAADAKACLALQPKLSVNGLHSVLRPWCRPTLKPKP